MGRHVCPWWAGYFIDNRFRRWLHNPDGILGPHVEPGMTALDFGCGMGLFAIAIARLVGEQGLVIAADVQPRMLEVLRRRAAKAGVLPRVRTHLCRETAIDLHEPIDFAVAFYAVHEVPDPGATLAEIHACLRPGSRFLLAEPIMHVSAGAFRRTLATAEQVGLLVDSRPRIRLSHAALLRKPP